MHSGGAGSMGETRVGLPGPAALLAEQQFRRVWMIGWLVGTVRWLDVVVIGIYVFDVTASPGMVAVVTFMRLLPMLAGAFAGTLAERLPLKRLLVTGLAVAAAVYLVLTGLAISGRLEVWHVGLGGFLIGFYWSTEMSVRRTLAGEIAGAARLGQAMGIDLATINVTRLVGPLTGGAIYSLYGITAGYLLNAALFGTATLLALGITHGLRPAGASGRKPFAAILDGLRAARASQLLMATIGITVCMNLFGFPYQSMVPVIGKEILNASPFAVGLLVSAEGVGAVTGSVVLTAIARPVLFGPVYAIGTGVVFLGVLAFGLSEVYALSLAVLFFVGFGSSGFSIMQSTLMLVHAPPDARSRLMGVLTTAIGVGQVGYLLIGAVATWVGAQTALVTYGVAGVAALGLCVGLWPRIIGLGPRS